MLRRLIRILAIFLVLLVVAAGATYLYFSQQYPDYEGSETLAGLQAEVTVYHDDFGVPHIEAESTTDAYHALGYLVARERFFQLDLARRLGGGKLSELFGEAALETDVLYRTLLPEDMIETQTRLRIHQAPKEVKEEVMAYIDGVNAYIESGEKPLEYTLLGEEMQPFEAEDLFRIAGYMAYSFCHAGRTEPVVTEALTKAGPDYLDGLALLHDEDESFNPSYPGTVSQPDLSALSAHITRALEAAPVPKFEGSNSWVVDGSRTQSGKPILCNDTHIGLGVPQVWFEAHVKAPGLEVYGNFLPGIPYCLVGHNRAMAWGVTMLENDDMDFFAEQVDPQDPGRYVVDSVSYPFVVDTVRFGVKDKPDTLCLIRSTYRGPVINDVFSEFPGNVPISCWWDYQRNPNYLLGAFRALNRCSEVEQAAKAVSNVAAPGLNVTYADTAGNIAWWTVAKWQARPPRVISKLIQDGSTRSAEMRGYLNFADNPQSINPPWGYVYTANDQPDSVRGEFLPGYYKPPHRADRIRMLLEDRRDWTQEAMKEVLIDVTSPHDGALARELQSWINWASDEFDATDLALLDWDGRHEVDDVSPTVFYKLMYRTLDNTMTDEMSPEWLERFLNTHWRQRMVPFLFRNPNSPWWDDVSTPGSVETRGQILVKSFRETLDELEAQLGPDRSQWTWGKVHTLTLEHPFAKASDALGGFFEIPEKPFRGGHETIAAAGFLPTPNGKYTARVGAQMRIVVDLNDISNSESIAPAGQSGHVFSPHFDDQAEAYRTGSFRRQDMDWGRLKSVDKRLVLLPE